MATTVIEAEAISNFHPILENFLLY